MAGLGPTGSCWKCGNGSVDFEDPHLALKGSFKHLAERCGTNGSPLLSSREELGRALKDSEVPREQLFLSGKLSSKARVASIGCGCFCDFEGNSDCDSWLTWLFHSPAPRSISAAA